MSPGLSDLQRQILDALKGFPSLEDCPKTARGDLIIASLPALGQVLSALGREATPANRATVSKALDRLAVRGEIAKARGMVAAVGGGYRYALLSRPSSMSRDGVSP